MPSCPPKLLGKRNECATIWTSNGMSKKE